MALKYNNNYYKIIKTTKNLLNETIDVELNVYETEEQRLLEKELEPQFKAFLTTARNNLDVEQTKLDNALNDLLKLAEEQGRDFHELLYEADDLKNQYNIQNTNIAEYEMLRDNMFNFKDLANKEALLNKWQAFGLNEALLDINVNKTVIKYTLDSYNDDLSNLYTIIKTNNLESAEDC